MKYDNRQPYLPRQGEIFCQDKDIFTENNFVKENKLYLKIVFFSPKFLPEHFHCFDEVARLNAFEIALKSFNQHQILFKNYFLSSDFKSLEGIFWGGNPHEGLARILITSKSTNREVASLHICVKWSIQYIQRWHSCTEPSRHGGK